ncbi:MAG: ferrous iron transport protein B [Sandaracinus sp.]|nr:ferrous iron transport protein B [Sandaracinus sp.]
MSAAPVLAPTPRVLLVGNPNAGKTTLFNALAGTRARTGNYPGVTVERRAASWKVEGRELELVDLPGTYSLSARSPEEQIAVESLLREAPAAVVVVLDATSLQRSLYLALQVRETGLPTVIALNMMDEARASGIEIDVDVLASTLGAQVVPIVASRGEGLDVLARTVKSTIGAEVAPAPKVEHDAATAADLEAVTEVAAQTLDVTGDAARAWATWALLSVGAGDELRDVPEALRDVVVARQDAADREGRDLDLALVGARYELLDRLVAKAVRQARPARTLTDRIDAVLVHPVLGFVAFAVVMYVVFETLFSWSEPAVGLIEDGVAFAQDLARSSMAEGPFRDLLVDGIVAGVGNVVVFVPQIALLFLLISFLEDSGYLARVAFVIDRVMKSVGLHGKAFVPLLSGFACAVPAVMATRTIASHKDRLVTMLALPLMSCSARLPVYVLVTATVFAGEERLGGIFSVGAVVLLSMYSLSVVATLAAAAVLRRTAVPGPRPTLVLELPPYRMPLFRNLLGTTWERVRAFLVDAGTIILALTIVLWALLAFPKSDAVAIEHESQRIEAREGLEGDALDERLSAIDASEAAAQLEHSAAGRLGKAIEPAIEPLGMDWRMGVGVIGAFAAREVFVSTLGIVFGIGEADEESAPLRERLRDARRSDGSKLMTPLSGVALMVFFVLACQCMSTLAVVKRESGSWKWPILMFVYMTVLAYLVTLGVFQIGTALGWGTG